MSTSLKRKYESIVIFSSKLGDDGVRGIIEKLKSLVSGNANLLSLEEWGKRRLAYPINYEVDGYYILMKFESGVDFPAEFNRVCGITDGIIRHLIVLQHEKKVVNSRNLKSDVVGSSDKEV